MATLHECCSKIRVNNEYVFKRTLESFSIFGRVKLQYEHSSNFIMFFKPVFLLFLFVCVYSENCKKHFRYEKQCILRNITNCNLSEYEKCPVYKLVRNYSKCPFYVCKVSQNLNFF